MVGLSVQSVLCGHFIVRKIWLEFACHHHVVIAASRRPAAQSKSKTTAHATPGPNASIILIEVVPFSSTKSRQNPSTSCCSGKMQQNEPSWWSRNNQPLAYVFTYMADHVERWRRRETRCGQRNTHFSPLVGHRREHAGFENRQDTVSLDAEGLRSSDQRISHVSMDHGRSNVQRMKDFGAVLPQICSILRFVLAPRVFC